MTTTICKTFDFDAAHFLPYVPDGHKCKRMHGHTYRVDVVLISSENELRDGMIVDYQEIADAWEPVHQMLDHYTLNDIAGLENPTTEILAEWIFAFLKPALPMLFAIRVHESSTTWAEYRVGSTRLA